MLRKLLFSISLLILLVACEDKVEAAKTPEEKLKAVVEKHFEVDDVKVYKTVNGKYTVIAMTEPKDTIISGTSEWLKIMNSVGDLLNDLNKYKLADKVETIKINLQYVSSDGDVFTPATITINRVPDKEIPFGAYGLIASLVDLNIPNYQFKNWFCDFAESKDFSPTNPHLYEWCLTRAQCKELKERLKFPPPQCTVYLKD